MRIISTQLNPNRIFFGEAPRFLTVGNGGHAAGKCRTMSYSVRSELSRPEMKDLKGPMDLSPLVPVRDSNRQFFSKSWG
jgi:hypothetical protein